MQDSYTTPIIYLAFKEDLLKEFGNVMITFKGIIDSVADLPCLDLRKYDIVVLAQDSKLYAILYLGHNRYVQIVDWERNFVVSDWRL